MSRLFPVLLSLVGCAHSGGFEAAASGPDDEAVKALVEQHFQAHVADQDALLSLWSTAGAHVSHLEHGQMVTVPATEAIALWSSSVDPSSSWQIEDVQVINSSVSTVAARLHWNGTDYAEHLTLLKDGGSWRLVSKTYSADAPVGFSGGY